MPELAILVVSYSRIERKKIIISTPDLVLTYILQLQTLHFLKNVD